MGDSHTYGDANPNFDSPFFSLQLEGGWFSPSIFRISTKPGIDPCLAVLFAHLCATEYSVAEIKHDLDVNTPDTPNYNLSTFGIGNINPQYQSSLQFNPNSHFEYNLPA